MRDNFNAAFPVGSLHFFMQAATTAATTIEGFALECNGTAVSRATYAALNTKLSGLSYPFGTGDGSTTMNLPDLQGRGLVAMASGGHADVNALGDSDGLAKASRTPEGSFSMSAHTHTGPSHTHTGPSHTHTFAATSAGDSGGPFTAGSGTTQLGNSHTHDVSGTTGAGGTGATGAGGSGNTGSGGAGSGAIDGAYLVGGVYGIKYRWLDSYEVT